MVSRMGIESSVGIIHGSTPEKHRTKNTNDNVISREIITWKEPPISMEGQSKQQNYKAA
jgi:hypothetical protein